MDITQLLAFTVKSNASDLHVSAGLSPMVRVDGELRPIDVPTLTDKEAHDLLYTVMSDKQRKLFEQDHEIDFSFAMKDVACFRVNVFQQNRGLGGVFRGIPEKILRLEDLQYPDIFKKICDYPNGLVLVTGSTGSGKSTALAAMIHHINQHRREHITYSPLKTLSSLCTKVTKP
jgi:twitching motility protein PilT